MQEFIGRLRPARRDSADLERERRALFVTECGVLRLRSGVEPRFGDAVLTEIPPQLPDAYRQLARVLLRLLDEPAQMVVVGDRGRGKTWLACAAVHAFCDVGRPALYRRTRGFFDELSRKDWSEKDVVRDAYVKPELLVLDEVQVRDPDRPWQDNELTELIDRRWARQRSTILLANLKPADVWTNLKASIQRRVIETGGVWETKWPQIEPLLGSPSLMRMEARAS